MAAGILNTVRVAGEGIALALVGAGLTALLAAQLGHAYGDAAGAAAQRLVTGDMAQALALLPGASRASLLQAYADAFSALKSYHGDAGLTLMTCKDNGTNRLLVRCEQKEAASVAKAS